MKTEPDIYAENPIVDLDYKIAVMLAYRNGARTQSRDKEGGVWRDTTKHNSQMGHEPAAKFNWVSFVYRIDPACKPQPPKIAEGNNPHGLTEEQVGVKDGWRLVTKEEIEHRHKTNGCPNVSEPQMWINSDRSWAMGENRCLGVDLIDVTYRTKKPAGFFLPKPKVRKYLSQSDLPATSFFLRECPEDSTIYTPLVVQYNGIMIVNRRGSITLLQYYDLSMSKWEYSTDRVNWKPCYKEVEQ